MAINGRIFQENTDDVHGKFLELYLAIDGMKFSALRWAKRHAAAHGFLQLRGDAQRYRTWQGRQRRSPGTLRACRRRLLVQLACSLTWLAGGGEGGGKGREDVSMKCFSIDVVEEAGACCRGSRRCNEVRIRRPHTEMELSFVHLKIGRISGYMVG